MHIPPTSFPFLTSSYRNFVSISNQFVNITRVAFTTLTLYSSRCNIAIAVVVLTGAAVLLYKRIAFVAQQNALAAQARASIAELENKTKAQLPVTRKEVASSREKPESIRSIIPPDGDGSSSNPQLVCAHTQMGLVSIHVNETLNVRVDQESDNPMVLPSIVSESAVVLDGEGQIDNVQASALLDSNTCGPRLNQMVMVISSLFTSTLPFSNTLSESEMESIADIPCYFGFVSNKLETGTEGITIPRNRLITVFPIFTQSRQNLRSSPVTRYLPGIRPGSLFINPQFFSFAVSKLNPQGVRGKDPKTLKIEDLSEGKMALEIAEGQFPANEKSSGSLHWVGGNTNSDLLNGQQHSLVLSGLNRRGTTGAVMQIFTKGMMGVTGVASMSDMQQAFNPLNRFQQAITSPIESNSISGRKLGTSSICKDNLRNIPCSTRFDRRDSPGKVFASFVNSYIVNGPSGTPNSIFLPALLATGQSVAIPLTQPF